MKGGKSATTDIPFIHGLRGWGVLVVVLFHLGWPIFKGGFLMISIFFTVSGFLITSILLNGVLKGKGFSPTLFLRNRIARLLPAVFTLLIVVCLHILILRFRNEIDAWSLYDLRWDLIWTLFYGTNWHEIDTKKSYFDDFKSLSPLRHTWSLAVEEQYYVIYALLFLTLAVVVPRLWRADSTAHEAVSSEDVVLPGSQTKALTSMVLGEGCVFLMSFAACVLITDWGSMNINRAYYGLDCHGVDFASGGILAVCITAFKSGTFSSQISTASIIPRAEKSEPKKRMVPPFVLVIANTALFAIIHVVMVFGSTATLAYYFAGMNVMMDFVIVGLITVHLIHEIQGAPRYAIIYHFFSHPINVYLGKLSYSLYLWHWPIIVWFGSPVTPSKPRDVFDVWQYGIDVVLLMVVFGVAYLSYMYIELPFQEKIRKIPAKEVFTATTIFSLLILGLILLSTTGAENRNSTELEELSRRVDQLSEDITDALSLLESSGKEKSLTGNSDDRNDGGGNIDNASTLDVPVRTVSSSKKNELSRHGHVESDNGTLRENDVDSTSFPDTDHHVIVDHDPARTNYSTANISSNNENDVDDFFTELERLTDSSIPLDLTIRIFGGKDDEFAGLTKSLAKYLRACLRAEAVQVILRHFSQTASAKKYLDQLWLGIVTGRQDLIEACTHLEDDSNLKAVLVIDTVGDDVMVDQRNKCLHFHGNQIIYLSQLRQRHSTLSQSWSPIVEAKALALRVTVVTFTHMLRKKHIWNTYETGLVRLEKMWEMTKLRMQSVAKQPVKAAMPFPKSHLRITFLGDSISQSLGEGVKSALEICPDKRIKISNHATPHCRWTATVLPSHGFVRGRMEQGHHCDDRLSESWEIVRHVGQDDLKFVFYHNEVDHFDICMSQESCDDREGLLLEFLNGFQFRDTHLFLSTGSQIKPFADDNTPLYDEFLRKFAGRHPSLPGGVSVIYFPYFHIMCPSIPCRNNLYGFKKLLPDNSHPKGETRLFLGKVILNEMLKYVPAFNDTAECLRDNRVQKYFPI